MSRILLEDASDWEPFLGEQPFASLDRHPSGELLAMQVSGDYTEKAAVWDARTKKIAWQSEGVNALCWTPAGDEFLVIRQVFRPDPEKPDIFVTPLQREFTHFLERRSWPDDELIDSCQVKAPTGWFRQVVASPAGSLACFVWQEQHAAGVEFVSWEDGPLRRLEGHGYYGPSPLLQGPAFSPDGRHITITYGRQEWWWAEDADDPNTPSRGGCLRVGTVVVGDVADGTYSEIPVPATVPERWLPDDPDDINSQLLSKPHVMDSERFAVDLPTGGRVEFTWT